MARFRDIGDYTTEDGHQVEAYVEDEKFLTRVYDPVTDDFTVREWPSETVLRKQFFTILKEVA